MTTKERRAQLAAASAGHGSLESLDGPAHGWPTWPTWYAVNRLTLADPRDAGHDNDAALAAMAAEAVAMAPTRAGAADALREAMLAAMPPATVGADGVGFGLHSDIFGWAIGRVDWHAVAGAIASDAALERWARQAAG